MQKVNTRDGLARGIYNATFDETQSKSTGNLKYDKFNF